MKAKIIFSAIIFSIICSFLILNSPHNDLNAKPAGNFAVVLQGLGEGDTNASVRMRSQTTGIDYYGNYDVPGIYLVDIDFNDVYDVFVCTNYPSYGSQLDVKGNSGGVFITLSSGSCPYGD